MHKENIESPNQMKTAGIISVDSEFKKRYGFEKDEFDFSFPCAFVKSMASKTGLNETEIGTLTEMIEMFVFNSPMTNLGSQPQHSYT